MASPKGKVEVTKDETEELFTKLQSLAGFELKVGIFGEKAQERHPDGDGITFGELAVLHEFDVVEPPRSYLRSTIDKNARKYLRLIERELERQVNEPKRTDFRKNFLTKLGKQIRDDIKKTIRAGIPPPLADGSGRTPLIKSGEFIKAIDFEVDKK